MPGTANNTISIWCLLPDTQPPWNRSSNAWLPQVSFSPAVDVRCGLRCLQRPFAVTPMVHCSQPGSINYFMNLTLGHVSPHHIIHCLKRTSWRQHACCKDICLVEMTQEGRTWDTAQASQNASKIVIHAFFCTPKRFAADRKGQIYH